MSVHGLYLDNNKDKIYTCHWKYIFIFLCLIKLSPSVIYLLHIKMLYFAFVEFFFLQLCGLIEIQYPASRKVHFKRIVLHKNVAMTKETIGKSLHFYWKKNKDSTSNASKLKSNSQSPSSNQRQLNPMCKPGDSFPELQNEKDNML